MKKTIFFTSVLFITVFISSCTTVYIPSEINAPAFSRSNQFDGGLSYGSSGTNLQLGYSFLKNFAAISDISFQNEFLDLIFTLRINYFNFTRYEYHKVTDPELPRAIGLEPAFKIRMGGDYLKFRLLLGLSLTETLTKHEFNYDKAFMNVGLEFRF